MNATIRNLAKAAGVSHTTVSLAFKGDSRISDETRRKVMQAARRLKYVPNLAARNLRNGNPRVLGILVLDITNPFWARMAREVENTARQHNYHVIVAESQWANDLEVFHLERMTQERVRGVLVCFTEKTSDGQMLLDRLAIPHVALDTFPAGYKGSYAANNLLRAGELAARHLLAVGCRQPVLFLPNHGRHVFSSLEHLRQGFCAALRAVDKRSAPVKVYDAGWTIEDGMQAYARLRADGYPAGGILCANDLCALGVFEAASRAGIRVGRDLALIGIDDLPVSQLSAISLTSIRQPDAKLAQIATQALIASIESGEPIKLQCRLDPELIVRDSTRLYQGGKPGAH